MRNESINPCKSPWPDDSSGHEVRWTIVLILACLPLSSPLFGTPDSPDAVRAQRPSIQTASAPASQRSDAATSRPQPDQSIEGRLRKLILRLGSADYRQRERAQGEIRRLGESAMPVICEYLSDPNPEIADRVFALVRRPRDAGNRIELAVRLLATGKPDRMERGVYMIFESPMTDYDLFVARTAGAKGLEQVIFEPVAEQMKNWRDQTVLFEKRQEMLQSEGKRAQALREREMHEAGMYYEAEAAYWTAVDAAQEYRAKPTESGDRDRPKREPIDSP